MLWARMACHQIIFVIFFFGGHLHEAGDEDGDGDGDGDGDVVDGGHLHEAGDEGGLGHHHSQLPQLVRIQLKASPYRIIRKMQQL